MDTLTTAPVVTGTSLAIIAPYLAYNLELADVRHPFLRHRIERVHIGEDGLRMDTTRIDALLDSEADGDGAVGFDEVLPVLRTLSIGAIQEKMPDGTIPALAIAQQLIGEANYWQDFELMHGEHGQPITLDSMEQLHIHYQTFNRDRNNTGSGRVVMSVPHLLRKLWVRVQSQDVRGQYNDGPFSITSGVIDYLRRHHFAIGLSPEQYIAK